MMKLLLSWSCAYIINLKMENYFVKKFIIFTCGSHNRFEQDIHHQFNFEGTSITHSVFSHDVFLILCLVEIKGLIQTIVWIIIS